MVSTNWLLTLIVIGFVLLCVGYSHRERQWGIAMLGFGVLSMLGTLAYKMYITLN